MVLHRHASDCSCCGGRSTVEHPSGLWKVGLVAAYVLFAAMVFGSSMMGLGLLAMIPVLTLTGLGLLPFMHDRAGAPSQCSACGKINTATPATVRTIAPVETVAPARAA